MYRSGDLLTLFSHLQLLWCYFPSHTSGACKNEDTAPVAAADGVTLGMPGAAGHHNSEMKDDSAPRSASSTVPKPNYAGMAGNKMVLFIWAPGARGLFLCGAGLMRSAKPSGHPPTPRSPSPSCLRLITAAALSQFIALLSTAPLFTTTALLLCSFSSPSPTFFSFWTTVNTPNLHLPEQPDREVLHPLPGWFIALPCPGLLG